MVLKERYQQVGMIMDLIAIIFDTVIRSHL
jgi:hypothetical protein